MKQKSINASEGKSEEKLYTQCGRLSAHAAFFAEGAAEVLED